MKRLGLFPSAGDDFSSFRRAHSIEKGGKIFLAASTNKIDNNKKNFFNYNQNIVRRAYTPEEIYVQFSTLNDRQLWFVAQQLKLPDPSREKILACVESVKATETEKLVCLTELYDSVVKVSTQLPSPQGTGPVTSYPLNDIRFVHCPEESMLMPTPVLVGTMNFYKKFIVEKIPSGCNVILQSFIAGVAPATVGWPKTLSIWINDSLVKSSTLNSKFKCNYINIDLSDFLPNFTLIITCEPENHPYVLLLRVVKFVSVSQIVQSIKNKSYPKDFMDETHAEIFSPRPAAILKYPGRSYNCEHSQCFNLKQFIKLAMIMNRWQCPICGAPAEIKHLYYSHKTDEYMMKVKSASQPVSPNPQAPDPTFSDNSLEQFSISDEAPDPGDFSNFLFDQYSYN